MITHINISEGFEQLIEKTLENELSMEIDRAIERFNGRKGEIIAGLLVNMMRSTDMRIMQDKIVIEVRNPNNISNI